MLNIIRIKKITFYAYHGVLSEEKKIGGIFEADLELTTDFTKAAEHDTLKDTADYDKIYKFVVQLVNEKKYSLIETLAMKIADGVLLNFKLVQKISVKVRKNNVPLGGLVEHVEAEVIKERSELENV